MPTGIAALIVTLQPVLTNALSGPILGEKVTLKQWMLCLFFFFVAIIIHLATVSKKRRFGKK